MARLKKLFAHLTSMYGVDWVEKDFGALQSNCSRDTATELRARLALFGKTRNPDIRLRALHFVAVDGLTDDGEIDVTANLVAA